jgi:hypothetical protein
MTQALARSLSAPRLDDVRRPAPEKEGGLKRQRSLSGLGNISEPLKGLLDIASAGLNAGHPRGALRLLDGIDRPAIASNYGFYARYGSACLGVVDDLNQKHILGSCELKPSQGKGFLAPEIKAERLDLYLKVVHSYNQFFRCLESSDAKHAFFEKNGEATGKACLEGAAAGLSHARREITLFLRRLTQANSNKASQDFVERSLASGRLEKSDPIVLSFREVQRDTLYEPLCRFGAPVNQAALEADQPATLVWQDIFSQEEERYGEKIKQAMAISGLT